MTIHCNVTGSERKRLAQVLGEIIVTEPVYTKAPTFAYIVGEYTVDKIGTVSCPDSATPKSVAHIIAKLADEGFIPEISENEIPSETSTETLDAVPETETEAMPETETTETDVSAETPETAEESEAGHSGEDEIKLTVSIPRDKLPDDALARLRTMVSNKEVLFKRALLADTLPIEASEDEISFPWFTLTGMDGETEAYTQFITHLCKMAAEQTRVLDKPYDGDNDRFAMRIFMVRLGMKGAQFALARKLMMKNLTGNSGWRYGAPPKKSEEISVAPTERQEVPSGEDTAPDAASDGQED